MERKLFSITFLFYFLFGICQPLNGRVINTTSGPVRGILNNWEGLYYNSYLGIPYAESPVGALRFQPPVPKRSWTRVLNATNEGFVCPQDEGKYKREQMSEDCLFINIHVPADIKHDRLPVLIFVHGGAFRLLSGGSDILYGPQLFLQCGLIFVTMNFRLGALGYLSLNIEEATGNAAIKDVLLSLKWIRANIERFGGDPNKLTIGGHSSGATLVHYLLLSEQSTGLFQQAILISGNAISHRSLAKHAKDNALTLAKELGLDIHDEQNLLIKLRDIDVFQIIDAETNMTKYDNLVLRPFAAFIPSIEIKTPHAVITSDPVEINKAGLKQNIPILAGFNSKEGIYAIPKIRSSKQKFNDLKENLELSIPSNIEYPLGSNESRALAKSIGQIYFNNDFLNITVSKVIDLASDSQYIYSTDSWIKTHKEKNNSNVLYYYIFDFNGDLNWCKINYNINFSGTAHADEIGYIFITQKTKPLLTKASFSSHSVMKMLTTLFSNFIKFGNPTPQFSPSKIKWPEYGKNKTLLLINENPAEITLPMQLAERLRFWHNVYDEYYRYVKNGGELEKKIIP